MDRRRLRRILLRAAIIVPIALVLIVLVCVLLVRFIVTDELVQGEAVSALTNTLGTPVKIDRLEYHTFSGVELEGLTIGPPPGFERDVAHVDRIRVVYDLSDFWSA